MKKLNRRFTLENFPVAHKTVLVRVDYNVPVHGGKVADNTKIRASLPTLRYLLSKGCTLILATHLGSPQGKFTSELSTAPLAAELQSLLPNAKVIKLNDCIGKEIKQRIASRKQKEVFLLENLRFYKEEEQNDFVFAQSLASLAEIYVNDAFAVSHREHASVSRITEFLPAVSGFLMEKEINNLNLTFSDHHPAIWIMGGAKLNKIDLMRQALKKADYILVGGALAFSFLKAQKINVGLSKVDAESVGAAAKIWAKFHRKIVLPMDFVAAKEFKMHANTITVDSDHISNNLMCLDLGPQTVQLFEEYLQQAKIIVWNGPLGYFEWVKFAQATKDIGRFLGSLDCIKIAGGGETTAALHKFHLTHNFTHVSTGGGAALEFLSGKKMPGIDALQNNYKHYKKQFKL